MKRYLALIAMSVLMLNLPAQNPNLDFKFSLKISNQFSYISQKQYDADTTLNDIIYQGKNYKLFQPTLAIQWADRYQNLQEVELTDLSFAGDLNVNLEVFDMYYKTSTDDDPTIPIGERTNSSINLGTAFPYAVNARIGAGLKF